jgi:hypothetical protein
MKSFCLGTYVLCGGVAVVLLAGCGGSPSPGAMPQSYAIAMHADHGTSWMKPGSSTGDLLYVPDFGGDMYVFTYPVGDLVASFEVGNTVSGLCSDSEGDVFVTSPNANGPGGFIYEYAHGGTSPVATLTDPYPYSDDWPSGCSRDQVTGNLAVVDPGRATPGGNSGDVMIYPNAQGTPTSYTDADIVQYSSAAYDDNGDLFVDGIGGYNSYPTRYGELSSGSGSFTDITLNESLLSPDYLQWDNGKLLIQNVGRARNSLISQVRISGSSGVVVKTISFNKWTANVGLPDIKGDVMVAPTGHGAPRHVGFWKYPKGGKPTMILKGFLESKHDGLVAATISVAPSDLGVRKRGKKLP